MSEIIFGTPEHVAGLSRKALEEDFQWVNDRRMELEGECERLDADNAKLRELCATVIDDWMSKVCPSFPFCEYGGEYQDCTDETCGNQIYRQMARELGVDE